MKQPSLDMLMSKVDSKYALVVAASKRARAITEGEVAMVRDDEGSKPVTLALLEIGEGKLKIESTKGGIK